MEVACRIVCTKSDNLVSKVGSFFLEEEATHLAVVFEDKQMVWHANQRGVHGVLLEDFLGHYQIVDQVEVMTRNAEKFFALWKDLTWDQPYDFGAWSYFAMRAVARRARLMEFPTNNAWEQQNGILCVEMVRKADQVLRWADGHVLYPRSIDVSMKTPQSIVTFLKQQPACRIVTNAL